MVGAARIIPPGVIVNVIDYDVVVGDFNSKPANMFTFRLITLIKDLNCLSPSYELNNTTSTRMALALNNPRRLICHQTKKLNK